MVLDVPYIFSGALTGFLLGLTGVGGGALMTPILLIFFDVNPIVAVGTDLWFAVFTKMAGAMIHYRAGKVDWQVANRLWCGSLTVSLLLGVFLFAGGHINKIAWLSQAIGIIIIVTSLGVLFSSVFLKNTHHVILRYPKEFNAYQAPLTVALGVVLGVVVSLTSIGAGTIGSVVLLYLYPLRMQPHALVATDLTHAIPLAAVAGTWYFIGGWVDVAILGNLLLGSIPAIFISSILARSVSGRKLQLVLGLVMFASGLKIISSV